MTAAARGELPAPAFEQPGVVVYGGDCLDILPGLPDASVHAVVTDPPYGLEFMNKEWDCFRPSSARLRTRVDKRTNPRKGKSVTTTPEAYAAGHPFQQWCEQWAAECLRVLTPGGILVSFGGARTWHRLAVAVEDAGFDIRDTLMWLYGSGFPKSHNVGKALDDPEWAGWGTALKPAHEPIVLARKPLSGTVAATVLQHSTGALNIDACRTAAAGITGRWPANVVFTHGPGCSVECVPGCPVDELDTQSGQLTSGADATRRRSNKFRTVYNAWPGRQDCEVRVRGTDSGGASRFFPSFRYQAKAPAKERPMVNGISHPTVKPLAFMRWLVRLVVPPGGVVLDPFLGSGTTAQACRREGFTCIGIERDPAYLALIEARLSADEDNDVDQPAPFTLGDEDLG